MKRKSISRKNRNVKKVAKKKTVPHKSILMSESKEKKKMPIKVKIKRWWKELTTDIKNKTAALIFFAISGLFIWAFFYALYFFYGFSIIDWIKDIPYLYSTFSYFVDEIKSGSDLGVFYVFMFSSLFFLPIPLEALFLNYLRQGSQFPTIIWLAVGGILAGQLLNFFLGRFLGFIFIKFIKKKTQKSIKHKLSKYGAIALFFVHLIPFPFQLFNFISGVLKYRLWKILLFASAGLLIKHFVMYWMYIRVA